MQIIPNFIEDKTIQEEIKNTLLGERSIPYYYNNYIVNENDKSDFHFVHFLYENNIHSHECSPMFDKILSPLIGRLKFNYLIRAKVNLYTSCCFKKSTCNFKLLFSFSRALICSSYT